MVSGVRPQHAQAGQKAQWGQSSPKAPKGQFLDSRQLRYWGTVCAARGSGRSHFARCCLAGLYACVLSTPLYAQSHRLPQFEVVARDGYLFPAELQVPAGIKFRLVMRNEGSVAVEFENLALRIERVVTPNGVSMQTVQALRPGRYLVIDEFRPDTANMVIVAR
jgi:Cupredoxin-like domain